MGLCGADIAGEIISEVMASGGPSASSRSAGLCVCRTGPGDADSDWTPDQRSSTKRAAWRPGNEPASSRRRLPGEHREIRFGLLEDTRVGRPRFQAIEIRREVGVAFAKRHDLV